MNGQPAGKLTLYCPLWGAAMIAPAELPEDNQIGLVGGQVLASVPFDDEWRAIQQTDVYLERLRSAGSVQIPPCLTCFEPLRDRETMGSAMDRAGPAMLQQSRDAVTALRLLKPGWFLQPELAETTFAVAGSGWQIERLPGVYRQAFVASDFHMTREGYSLNLNELTTMVMRGRATEIFELLQQYRASGGNGAVDIALENFDRSYGGMATTDTQRAANLFIALDAMLGGMSARRIDRTRLRQRFFRRRVEAALAAADPNLSIDAAREARWLDARDGARSLRNALAHGDAGALDHDLAEAVPRLEHIVRALLLQGLRFSLKWAAEPEAVSARFGVAGPRSFTAAYNKALEGRAAGKDTAVDLL
jgi:hypothetical protein